MASLVVVLMTRLSVVAAARALFMLSSVPYIRPAWVPHYVHTLVRQHKNSLGTEKCWLSADIAGMIPIEGVPCSCEHLMGRARRAEGYVMFPVGDAARHCDILEHSVVRLVFHWCMLVALWIRSLIQKLIMGL